MGTGAIMAFAFAFLNNEKQFLSRMEAFYPGLAGRLAKMLEVYPPDRPNAARSILAQYKPLIWHQAGIPVEGIEPVAAHIGMMAKLAYEHIQPTLDFSTVLQMIDLSALPRAITGEPAPNNQPNAGDIKALNYLLFRVIHDGNRNPGITSDFKDAANPRTPEAAWVRDLDKLATAALAFSYLRRYPECIDRLGPIIGDMENKLQYPGSKDILHKIRLQHEVVVHRPQNQTAAKARNDLKL